MPDESTPDHEVDTQFEFVTSNMHPSEHRPGEAYEHVEDNSSNSEPMLDQHATGTLEQPSVNEVCNIIIVLFLHFLIISKPIMWELGNMGA